MVHLRILHAKNQHPRPVACRPRSHRQTDRQIEKANTGDPFFEKKIFILDLILKEWSEYALRQICIPNFSKILSKLMKVHVSKFYKKVKKY